METLKKIMELAVIKPREFQKFKHGNLEQMRASFVEAFNLVDKTFEKYQHLPEYNRIIEWLNETKGKGLFLTGSFGRGKSTIITGVLPLLFLAYYQKVLKPIAAREMHKTDLKWAIVIDDIGQEEIINDYGTKVDAVEYAISHCEDHNKLLIVTTNLTASQIRERYGERILDRINRLCIIVEFKGKSLRK